MLTVVITNLTASEVSIDDMYAKLGAAGSSTASMTITATSSQLDQMDSLKQLVNAATVSCVITKGSTDIDLLTTGIDQRGTSAVMLVDSVAVVTQAITFPKIFGAAPLVSLTIVQGATTNFKAQAYVRSVTTSGFTIALDVTTAGTASGTCTVNWTASY